MKKILFVSPEVSPYTASSEMGDSVISQAKKLSSKGHEVRIFIPKYKSVKDRKHQLHEVVRLSGLNVEIDKVSQPITLKVTTVPKERIQIYFIENEDYFKRDGTIYDENNDMYDDAYKRTLMYSKSTLEIVKRLNWSPDSIVLQGWMSYMIIPFLKDYYKNDETFKNSRLILNYFKEKEFDSFKIDNMKDILISEGISEEFSSCYNCNSYSKLMSNTVTKCDTILEEDKIISKDYFKFNKDGFIEKDKEDNSPFFFEEEVILEKA